MAKEDTHTQDDLLIEQEFNALIDDYLKTNHRRKVDIITKAFLLAKEAHKGARRRSGEPYILHPIAVARIACGEIGLGSTSICAALLHDVVEDTEYTVDDIKVLFGEKIAQIVDGLTKISSGMFGENVSAQAENFRKLLLTMSDDIRVILVKIADRLHNMRTLGSMAPAKQYKIAGETMYIYAPLAHRLGLFAIKTELEELSFKWENPEVYNDIELKLRATHNLRAGVYSHFAEPVIEKLNELGFRYEIRAREKSVYSIWNKMQAKGVPFEEIYDIFAVRIIFENEPGIDEKKRCWDIYSVITDIYKLRPDRIRDWVSRPKSNGYQALHLTVMGPDGQWIEIQIRSRRMDDIAEKGFAAHWKYKEGKIEEDTELDKWLKTIKEILESPSPNAMDFLDTIKLNLFSQEIFVFTPKGEIRTLAQGATALDFAYDLHSDIGDHCIGAKVNHKLVPLSEKLNSGDQVEILTSKTQHPKPEWLGLITTAKARTKIEYALRKSRREMVKKGEEILTNTFKDASMELTPVAIDRMMDYYQKVNKEDLFYAIGNNDIALPQRLEKLLVLKRQNPDNLLLKYMKQAFHVVKKSDKDKAEKPTEYEPIDPKKTYILEEDSFSKNFRMPTCCNPIPGDKVFGYINEDNEVDVHSIHCPVGLKLKASHGDHIVNLEWGSYTQFPFLSSITVTGIDRMGMLSDISKVITAGSLNIKNLNIETNDGIFEGRIVVYVHDVNDLQTLCSRIAKIKGVKAVNRKQGL
ncbi:guanosine-3',5'-bis(diphosphate) 3'-pyrophosphohydrolase [Dysgonomonas sp. PFB1-18]|uniref:RelA/SpoT family protein n=1 Tax=unclassified Dysgonomonas TaxID=2630389 RepID=UPI0024771E8A|nr:MULTISPECIES: RelA/SpoT family protein [unclassified Dysgonomonas]MDH6308210.1 guanosine-3',5'-bis(diphosphate) 3'-pyrophosphohydrolase [Dysgonomonas sp. PF1-14]MDH6338351.1 guanosine-3',5'-bis(diphosphate) 3'-pyrophosphohydrolase [Dysgonomonas sp. PF1-16]MDH6379848.1 guanosine-3',5'-bis(diphosphate) 3'-pyrophosphohydrolase [Dysgonomonas sp. PFB1-18]MDH6397062.1 guanosine-3',5'-bis(diphosphate) 3'-pyrophosphohydrolase [Dysgonomonas sp. PF1-23]